jgi:site-specific recombinase XerD
MRFWDSIRIDQKSKTGLQISHIYWSDVKEKAKLKSNFKQKDFINENLKDLKDFISESYVFDYNSKVYIHKNWLKEKIEMFFGRTTNNELHKVYFIDWIVKFIEEAPKRLFRGKPISNRTIQHYTTTKHKLVAFEEFHKTKLRFEHIDLKFYRDFLFYCREEQKLNNNTIGGFITNIKMWCKNIEIEGLPINQQYKHSEFMSISAKTKDIYLNEKQIMQVYNHDFTDNPKLDNVRDLFIIGLRTGLRISDFLKLKNINLKEGFIEIENFKTEEFVIIPLHENIKEILAKRKGELPRSISDQKFNEYVKKVCEEAKLTEIVEGARMLKETKRKKTDMYPIYELVSSHICRRSFASNLYGKLPNMTIMAITGHRTESLFLRYIKITNKEHALKLQEHWKI